MEKLRVLTVPSDATGVGKYRNIAPHTALEKLYRDEFHVDIDYNPQIDNDEWLKQYDLIHFHRTIGDYDKMDNYVDGQGVSQEGTIPRLRRLGIPTIMDLDDYWSPGPHHPAYLLIKQSGIDKKIIKNLQLSDYVCTTTDIFANEIRKYNKNVFVLANAIDPTEKQYIPNPEPSNRLRISFLGGSCYDDKTEILTENGFKLFKDLTEGEKVATLNTKSNELEYQTPIRYINEPYNGLLNCGKGKYIDYAVTPNHNMYASEHKPNSHKKLNLKLVQSENIQGKDFHVKRDAKWVGIEEKFFTLPRLKNRDLPNIQFIIDLFKDGNPNDIEANKNILIEHEGILGVGNYTDYNSLQTIRLRKSVLGNYYLAIETYLENKYGDEKLLDMDKWLEFFGFWVAEGWTSKTKGLHQVGIAQKKDNDYLEKMFNILTDLGFNPTYTKDKYQIRVFDHQLWEYLGQFGDALEKYIPRFIFNLSPRQQKLFLDWYIKGDGHIGVQNGKYIKTTCFTSSQKLSNDLQELAFKMGLIGSIKNRGKRISKIRDRQLINVSDSIEINISKHPNDSKSVHNTPLIKNDKQFTKQYNGNVYCVEVPNHILMVRRNNKMMWCGNSHLKDLEILQGVSNKLKSDGLLDKVQFVLCGFDLRGSITMIDEKTGERKQRPIEPKESVWYEYEKIFTDNYSIVSPKYKEYLLSFTKEEYPDLANEPYRRVWTKPINTYATNYNLFDVSLAPLAEHVFNAVKSNLKIVEAGFHKKAIICQDFGPYQKDIINAFENGGIINPNGNGLLVPSEKNHKLWYQYIKKLINNPELVKQLQDNLYNTVKDTYSIENVTKQRREFYKSIIKKK